MAQTSKDYQYDRNDNNTFGVRGKADTGTDVVANPTGEATADLEKLQVGDTIYGIPEGTEVVANPTLAGTEPNLTGLQVGDDKYAVPQPINVVANPVLAGTENPLESIEIGSTKYKNQPASVQILTTAPVADNTDGLKFVVLTSEPATYYNGYYYIIAPTTT